MRTKRMISMLGAVVLAGLLQMACSGAEQVLLSEESSATVPGQPGASEGIPPPTGQDETSSGGGNMTQ